jgi:RNA polymerase sigma factor, sigma-70 family
MTAKERDFHLVQKALGGDNKACETIYKKFFNSLNYQIGKIVLDSEIALDLTMETFEKVFTRLHWYKPDYCLSTWVQRIGTNCALDYVRHVSRISMVSIEASVENEDSANIQVVDEEKTPEERIIFEQKITYLKGLMKFLPEEECQLLKLYYIEDMGYNEIAEMLELSVGYVKINIEAARKNLRKLTQEISVRKVFNKERINL